MDRFTATDQTSDRHQQAPADAATWLELYFPRVEDLLQQLATAEHQKRHARHSLLSGTWTLKTTAILAFICVPGCATAAMLLMKAGKPDLPPVPQDEQQIVAKADRLPLIKPPVRIVYSGVEKSSLPAEAVPAEAVPAEAVPEPILSEGIALRGTIESVMFTTSAPSAPAAVPQKPRRNANRTPAVKPVAEPPNAVPRSPSLLEKLFSVIDSVTQFSPQPSQRQT